MSCIFLYTVYNVLWYPVYVSFRISTNHRPYRQFANCWLLPWRAGHSMMREFWLVSDAKVFLNFVHLLWYVHLVLHIHIESRRKRRYSWVFQVVLILHVNHNCICSFHIFLRCIHPSSIRGWSILPVSDFSGTMGSDRSRSSKTITWPTRPWWWLRVRDRNTCSWRPFDWRLRWRMMNNGSVNDGGCYLQCFFFVWLKFYVLSAGAVVGITGEHWYALFEAVTRKTRWWTDGQGNSRRHWRKWGQHPK